MSTVWLRRITFIVDVQRTTPKWDCSVINDGAEFRSNFLSDESGKCGSLLPIEVGFKAVANRFMQQNSGPAWSKNDLHWARQAHRLRRAAEWPAVRPRVQAMRDRMPH